MIFLIVALNMLSSYCVLINLQYARQLPTGAAVSAAAAAAFVAVSSSQDHHEQHQRRRTVMMSRLVVVVLMVLLVLVRLMLLLPPPSLLLRCRHSCCRHSCCRGCSRHCCRRHRAFIQSSGTSNQMTSNPKQTAFIYNTMRHVMSGAKLRVQPNQRMAAAPAAAVSVCHHALQALVKLARAAMQASPLPRLWGRRPDMGAWRWTSSLSPTHRMVRTPGLGPAPARQLQKF